MELIPIIYTVLIIVIVLTVATLTISYISFKVKTRKNGTLNGEKAEIKRSVPVHKIIPVPAAPVKNQSVKPHHASHAKKTRDGEKPSRKTSAKEKTKSRGKSQSDRNERLSVMKNLSDPASKNTKTKETPTNTVKHHVKSLGDDILDKYVEENDKDLFTLNVKEKKKKPE
jgi:hypothetical protein